MKIKPFFIYFILSFFLSSSHAIFAEESQVHVEARVLEINDTNLEALGVTLDDVRQREHAFGSDGRGVDGIAMSPTVIDPSDSNFEADPNGNANFEIPNVNTRSVSTTIALTDGETVALAGTLEKEENDRITRVPFLGKIPLIGRLFRSETNENPKDNLLVVVTPSVVKTDG